MTTRHVPGTGRHQQLTRLPDLAEAKAQRDAEAAAHQTAEERVKQLESEVRRLRSGS